MIYMFFKDPPRYRESDGATTMDYRAKDRSMIRPEHRLAVLLLDACDSPNPDGDIYLPGVGTRGVYGEGGSIVKMSFGEAPDTWYILDTWCRLEDKP